MRRVVIGAVATVVVVLLGAGLTAASAASVPLRPGTLVAFAVSDRCTTATLTVRPAATSGRSQAVVIPDLPSECLGRPYVLRLFGASGPLAATDTTGTLPTSGTTATLTVPRYAVAGVTGVALTVSTWGVRTAWSTAPTGPAGVTCRVPADPAARCDVALVSGGDWSGNYLRRFEVTSPSATPVVWELTFDLSDTGQFPFLARAFTDVQGGLVLRSTSGCAASPRTVTVGGTTSWGSYDTVGAGRSSGLEVHGGTVGTGSLLTCP